ncbi:sphingosine kinase 1-like [Palaemon carinicauda]|uniref:sphingosine kinase 1-like n=1 Tax=Palaemon carinicauda TaxID=392227 RepID=UPI0035B59A29
MNFTVVLMEEQTSSASWCMTGLFKQYRVKNDGYNVEISDKGLTVISIGGSASSQERREFYEPTDLIGCVCMRAGPKEPRKHLAFFTVYAYPFAPLPKKKKRIRVCLSFVVESEDTYEKNLEIANEWRSAVYSAIRGKENARGNINRRKKLLIVINPNSGAGRALRIYKKQVAPVLGEAEVPHEVLITKAANHALNLVRSMDLDQYAGLVIVSGDGLLYEIYNGLLSRPDWDKAIEYPVGVIPGGSGNGLARSLAHYLDEPYLANPVLVSTLNLAYGYTSPMDLVLVHTPDAKRLSFLSIGLGLLSDIDIESERLRSFGESRFTLWAIARIANLRRYHAKLSFKRLHKTVANNNHRRHPFQRSQTVEEEPYLASTGESGHISRSHSIAKVEEDDFDMNASLVKVDPVKPEESPEVGFLFNGNSEYEQSEKLSKDITAQLQGGCCMPKLGESLPNDWETVEDDFIIIYAVYQSHIGTDVFIAPNATLNDGTIWLLIVHGHATKSSITRFLLAMDGSHINIPGVEMIPVEAFRVEPSGKSGYLTVDGEVIPWGPLQAQILPSKGKIITR